VKGENPPRTAAAGVAHWDIFERLGLPSWEKQQVILVVLGKIPVCAVNMPLLVHPPAADPGRAEAKTDTAYEVIALEILGREHHLLNQEHSCSE